MSREAAPGRVRLETRDHLATIVLENPERRNAVSLAMWAELEAAARSLAETSDVRCVVVRGAGEVAFVSGADVSEFGSARASAAHERAYAETSGRAVAALLALEQPVVALIHGFCFGGGVALSLACDLRYAADDAVFAIPAARLGLGYAFGAVEALQALVGPATVKEMLFTARRYAASEAQALGLVNRVFPRAELDTGVAEIAAGIAANAPFTLRAVKRAVREALRDPARRDLAAVEKAIEACFDSRDYQEGVRAFLEKRPPRFEGR